MKILIADDHALMRTGLSDVLIEGFPHAEVLQASDVKQALGLVSGKQPLSLAIVDLFMPDMDGFCFVQKLCEDYPALPVVVISASDNPKHISKALKLGVSGYIPKSASQQQFLGAIERILSGGTYIPEEFVQPGQSGSQYKENPDIEIASIKNTLNQLTARQLDILGKLGQGLSNKMIARDFNLSENTVKVHVSTVLKILELDNRTQAGVFAKKLEEIVLNTNDAN